MKSTPFIIVLILLFSGTANAQFLKNLGDKLENAVEKTIESEAIKKATEKTEAALDSLFNDPNGRPSEKSEAHKNGRSGGSLNIPGLSKATPKASYAFNHKIEMQITTEDNVMGVNYYLPDNGDFLCAELTDEQLEGNYWTVFDVDQEAMFTYMNNEGQKSQVAMDFKMDEAIEEVAPYTITATGKTKTILGYQCQEYDMTGEDMTATIWVTKDVDIRFPSNFYNVKQNKYNNQEWMKDVDGWAMEMVMIDTSKRKPQTITMICLSIEKSSFTINSSDYSKLGF